MLRNTDKNQNNPRYDFDEIFCSFVLLSACLQTVRFLEYANETSFKLYHLVIALFIIYSFAKKESRWRIPHYGLLICMVIFLFSLLNFFTYGISSTIVGYCYMFGLIFALYNVAKNFSKEKIERTVQNAAVLLTLFISFNIVISSPEFAIFGGDRNFKLAIIPFFGGGTNLEATWLAIFGVFFKNNLKGTLYFVFCGVVSGLLYASRTGTALVLLAFLYVFLIKGTNSYKTLIPKMVFGITCFAILLIVLPALNLTIFERFFNQNEDNGMLGRLAMWSNIYGAWYSSPVYGVGAGNAILAIEQTSGVSFIEGNVHNYFAQVFLDFGSIGFVIYILLLVSFIKGIFAKKSISSIDASLLCILIASCFQFRGGDVLMGFMIGLFLIQHFREHSQRNYRNRVIASE